METKEQRRARQLKQYKKVILEIKESVKEMYKRKVLHDAYYQNNGKDFTVSEVY